MKPKQYEEGSLGLFDYFLFCKFSSITVYTACIILFEKNRNFIVIKYMKINLSNSNRKYGLADAICVRTRESILKITKQSVMIAII